MGENDKKISYKNHKKIKELLPMMLAKFKEENLTLQEVADTSKVDINFIEALLDEENPILSNLSRLVDFARIKCSFRQYEIPNLQYKNYENYIVLSKSIEPKCQIKYDKVTGQFYDLIPKKSNYVFSYEEKQNLLYEFQKFMEEKVPYEL